MELKAISNAKVLIATDGSNALFIDIGSAVIPVAVQVADGITGSGEDGGYYTPNVDMDTGNVSWTPSKATMPAIAPSNIRGPAGRSVYGINFSVDANGALTGGTVYYDDGSTSRITFSLSTE